jgi:UDP-hydrolysing UDP-N-acetyl-D-glucosamine 2-epimerase
MKRTAKALVAKAPARKAKPRATPRRLVAIVTGSRAEFGLLRPVIDAVGAHAKLDLALIVAGSHLLPPTHTIREIARDYPIAAEVPMQRASESGAGTPRTRHHDAVALARGVDGFARAFETIKPDWVVVLGDRIEAFAAACAASVAGLALCHIHGGDRAEGIADEAMRHATSKLAHLHCAATSASATRLIKLGERPEHIHVTGSPAIDGLRAIKPMSDADAHELGDPRVVVLLHPSNEPVPAHLVATPSMGADAILAEQTWLGLPALGHDAFGRVLLMHPNHDAGREQILASWRRVQPMTGWPMVDHLPRERFVALLKRLAGPTRGLLLGNSSAGLIECAALGVPAVNLGRRQAGRERGPNVIDADPFNTDTYTGALRRAMRLHDRLAPSAIFGDGRAGPRIAALLARTDPRNAELLRKRNTY